LWLKICSWISLPHLESADFAQSLQAPSLRQQQGENGSVDDISSFCVLLLTADEKVIEKLRQTNEQTRKNFI